MGIWRSRFQLPSSFLQKRRSEEHFRTEILEPVLGLNVAQPAQHLRPGETPESQNFVLSDQFLAPRSGLSNVNGAAPTATTLLSNQTPIAAFRAYATAGSELLYILSSSSAVKREPATESAWTTFSAAAARSSAGTPAPEVFYDNLYDSAVFYDPLNIAGGGNQLIWTQWLETPKQTVVGTGGGTGFSNLSSFLSVESYARFVETFDERLIFFSTRSEAGAHRPRVRWSVRGSQLSFQEVGSGFQDLAGLVGLPSGLAKEVDRLILTSTEQVWIARPRRDAYAFDFQLLEHGRGNVHPLSLQATEAGTIWLGADWQFYRLLQNQVRPLGDKIRTYLRDNVREQHLCFSEYNEDDHTYKFFFSNTTGQYPDRAFFLRTDTIAPSEQGGLRDDGAWFLQTFPIQIAAATQVRPALEPREPSRTVVVSSRGTPYWLDSARTNDDGTAFTARWRSHGLSAQRDRYPYEAIDEVWLEIAPSASTHTVNVRVSADLGATFESAGTISLSSVSETAFLPVAPLAARHPMLELQITDGSTPRIGRMQIRLRAFSGRFP